MHTKFCVLTLPRSGSTYLLSLLDSHPQVRSYEELFLARPVREEMRWVVEGSPERFYDFCGKTKWPRPISTLRYFTTIHAFDLASNAVGFKVMIPQVKMFPELIACLYAWHYRVIFLVRQNLLEACLSARVRLKTGIAHSRDSARVDPMEVGALQLLKDVKKRRRHLKTVESILRIYPYPWIKVEYEAVRNNPQNECDRIFRFLQVQPGVKVDSKINRIVTVRYDTILTNYSDIRRAFSENGLAEYLS